MDFQLQEKLSMGESEACDLMPLAAVVRIHADLSVAHFDAPVAGSVVVALFVDYGVAVVAAAEVADC